VVCTTGRSFGLLRLVFAALLELQVSADHQEDKGDDYEDRCQHKLLLSFNAVFHGVIYIPTKAQRETRHCRSRDALIVTRVCANELNLELQVAGHC